MDRGAARGAGHAFGTARVFGGGALEAGVDGRVWEGDGAVVPGLAFCFAGGDGWGALMLVDVVLSSC